MTKSTSTVRSARLFHLVHLLKHASSLTAEQLANRLNVSTRTVYRDVRTLIETGVRIRGAAGVGYRIDGKEGYTPLQLTETERQALAIGTRWLQTWADGELSQATHNLLNKLNGSDRDPYSKANVPDFIQAPPGPWSDRARPWFEILRIALSRQHKVHLRYRTRSGKESERTIQPLGLLYWGATWTIAAFCELRSAFRSFRLDRITDCIDLKLPIEHRDGINLANYLSQAQLPSPCDERHHLI